MTVTGIRTPPQKSAEQQIQALTGFEERHDLFWKKLKKTRRLTQQKETQVEDLCRQIHEIKNSAGTSFHTKPSAQQIKDYNEIKTLRAKAKEVQGWVVDLTSSMMELHEELFPDPVCVTQSPVLCSPNLGPSMARF